MAPTTKTSKPIFKTASPFAETKWPQISHDDQDVILDLVCNLIAPLGDHRKTHITPSKGKKRKRKSKDDPTKTLPPPPQPEIGKHLLVGINSVTRHLELLAARNAASTMPIAACNTENSEATDEREDDKKTLSMVIITHPKPSMSPAHAHLPTLVHLSTLKPSSSDKTTRLIPLATSTDVRFASTLHIPRVGALAIFSNAPGAKALEDFVRSKVGITECPWIDEATSAQWTGTNVKTEYAAGKIKPDTKPKTNDKVNASIVKPSKS